MPDERDAGAAVTWDDLLDLGEQVAGVLECLVAIVERVNRTGHCDPDRLAARDIEAYVAQDMDARRAAAQT